MDYSLWFVCLMGMGTVFFGLVCIIILTKLMSAVLGKKPAPAQSASRSADALPQTVTPELPPYPPPLPRLPLPPHRQQASRSPPPCPARFWP